MKRFLLPILLAAALPAADSRIMPAMNAFTTASFKQLMGGGANLILSPFNIATALSMALAGARGQTAAEIQSVLHLHYDSAYDAALGALLADLTKAGNTGGNELYTANGLWVQKGFAIQPASRTRSPTTTTPHSRRSISSRIPRPRDPRSTAGPKSTPKRRSRTCSRPAHLTPGPALS